MLVTNPIESETACKTAEGTELSTNAELIASSTADSKNSNGNSMPVAAGVSAGGGIRSTRSSRK